MSVGVISDIHVDLREHARHGGLGDLVDHWILSFEHGTQKPSPDLFELALATAEVAPSEALMVGDRVSHDGAAAGVGMDVLILPFRPDEPGGRLDVVLDLVTGT